MIGLQKLLESKTLFIFGAGASFDYGFPSRNTLREHLIYKIRTSIDTGIELPNHITKSDMKMVVDKLMLSRETNETLDKIVDIDYSKSVKKIFRYFVGKILIECENNDLNFNSQGYFINSNFDEIHNGLLYVKVNYDKPRRINTFALLYADILFQLIDKGDENGFKLAVSNFNVATLNYERLFSQRFWLSVYNEIEKKVSKSDKIVIRRRDRYNKEMGIFGRVKFFHGAIGTLGPMDEVTYNSSIDASNYENLGNNYECRYGDTLTFEKRAFKFPLFPFIYPINWLSNYDVDKDGKVKLPKNSTYAKIEKEEYTNIILNGLSSSGINQSLIPFKEISGGDIFIFNSQGNNHYYLDRGEEKIDEERFNRIPIYKERGESNGEFIDFLS